MSTRQAISATTVDHLSALPMPNSILCVLVQASWQFNLLAAITALITTCKSSALFLNKSLGFSIKMMAALYLWADLRWLWQ